jgi:16S rRNA (cytidine1402-2'-O)-methyltransferase
VSGTLYVVATPIGNLEDITLRALRLLREVAVIAAEDTRRTAKLLIHHAISTPTISFHNHNVRTRVPQLLARLEGGASVALVSDAGTPGVSDPGLELVQACIARGIPVDPVPGASAVLAALVASGFPTSPVTFLGFPPVKAKDRIAWWAGVASQKSTVVLFEAPHRIASFLTEGERYLGNRPMMLARELTKLHQEFIRGTALSVGKCLKTVRGEFTVVLGPQPELDQDDVDLPASDQLVDQFRYLTENSRLTRRQAIAELSRRYDRPSREVYARLEAAKGGLS